MRAVLIPEWKVREDEAKEWGKCNEYPLLLTSSHITFPRPIDDPANVLLTTDAAGNMNNVYTAPHAPAPVHDTPAPAAVAESTPEHKEVPAATAVAPSTTETAPAAESTKVDNLLASSAPGAASAGHGLGAYNLGAIVAGGGVNTGARSVDSVTIPTVPAVAAVPAAAAPSSVNKATAVPVVPAPAPVIATAAVPIAAAPVVTDPTPVQINKLAANANIGEAPTGHEEKSIQERATEFGAGALAAISAAATQAAAAVERQTGVDPVAAIERATGVDLHHGSPVSIREGREVWFVQLTESDLDRRRQVQGNRR